MAWLSAPIQRGFARPVIPPIVLIFLVRQGEATNFPKPQVPLGFSFLWPKWCCRFITCDGCVNCGARFRLPRRFPREKFGYRLRGAGPSAERATRATKGAFRTTPLSRVMSVMPFFEFVLVMVGIGTLAILLTALLLTATARLH